jgi:hypothetical protein
MKTTAFLTLVVICCVRLAAEPSLTANVGQSKSIAQSQIQSLVQSEIQAAAYARLITWNTEAGAKLERHVARIDDRKWISEFASLFGMSEPLKDKPDIWGISLSPSVEFVRADGVTLAAASPRGDRIEMSHGGLFDVYRLPPDIAKRLAHLLTGKESEDSKFESWSPNASR